MLPKIGQIETTEVFTSRDYFQNWPKSLQYFWASFVYKFGAQASEHSLTL